LHGRRLRFWLHVPEVDVQRFLHRSHHGCRELRELRARVPGANERRRYLRLRNMRDHLQWWLPCLWRCVREQHEHRDLRFLVRALQSARERNGYV
jgi:hypothetical protein